jgi:hypothetical protein
MLSSLGRWALTTEPAAAARTTLLKRMVTEAVVFVYSLADIREMYEIMWMVGRTVYACGAK